MRILKVDDILDKGLEDENSLDHDEKLIYSVAYLESIADMQGWDHFFTYTMEYYPDLIKLLKLSEDSVSLNILENYRNHFKEMGVSFNPESIENFLCTATDEYLMKCPDWREEFTEVYSHRWKLIANYCAKIGVQLKT
ncbi:DMP19 family protein [Marinicellulosiphila megalodicopiae]|uniref:DMP19 family protein n=1 Tax=Marinicellulosiphila megalodicopiae TaxID=2724896 RepID=UPI003BB0FAE2